VLVVVGIMLAIVGALCGLIDLWGTAGVREQTGYLASVGNTEASYEAIDAFIVATFPLGMRRDEVLSLLGERFICRVDPMGSYQRNNAQYVEDTVAFPGLDCEDMDAWRDGEDGAGCRGVEFSFEYTNDRLERVTMVVS
jgi:hypothetical protein